MKIKAIIPMMIILLALTIQCSKDDKNEEKTYAAGSISGNVTTTDEGTPVVGAEVTTVPVSGLGVTYTDNNGDYTLDLNGGIYTLKITKDNYVAISKSITIDGNNLVQDFEMEETPLTAGTCKFDCVCDYGFSFTWSQYNSEGTCTLENGDVYIESSVTMAQGPNDHIVRSIIIKINSPVSTGTIDLATDTTSYIFYKENPSYTSENDLYSTQYAGSTGTLTITFYNALTNTIKGTFEGNIKDNYNSDHIDLSSGTFRGKW